MTGELVMTVLLALARMERRRISESWETAKVRALDRGAKIGRTPFGYRRAEGGRLGDAQGVGGGSVGLGRGQVGSRISYAAQSAATLRPGSLAPHPQCHSFSLAA
jgi:hypothetical protein